MRILRARAGRVGLVGGALLSLWLASAGSAAAAGPVWTPVASNTTDDISAIDYQADDRFWFATTNGKIFRREAGTFVQRLNAPGVVFNDVEMRGAVGLAVGNAGVVYRTADTGANWTQVMTPMSNEDVNCNLDKPFGDSLKVVFATDTLVYVFGDTDQILRSTDAGATFTNSNRSANAQAPCKIGPASRPVAGAFFVPGAPTPTAYLLSGREVFFSGNDLASAQSRSSGLDFFGPTRLAVDPTNPNRQWDVESGSINTSRTENGWTTSMDWAIGNPTRRTKAPTADVAYSGGTVLMAGAAGEIMNSVDGKSFFFVDAGPPLAAQSWRAVGLASGAKAAVGGAGGALVLSENANTTPDVTPPTGTIGGPSAVTVGQPATFTAQLADEPGGSGVDAPGSAWTVDGLPAQQGPSATFTFPEVGATTIRLVFKDLAGNTAEVSRSVVVNAAPKAKTPPVKTAKQTFSGGTISFSFPGSCVKPGSTFTVRLAFKRSRKKGNKVVKVSSTRFYAQGKSVFLDKKAPFAARLKVIKAKAGTTYRLQARATLKITRGKPRTRSIKATVKVC